MSSTTLHRPCSLRVRSAQDIPPTRPQRLGAQQLSLKSSTTLLRPCSPRVGSAQAFSPQGLSARSPADQFDEFDYSTQAMQPKSQISSGYSAHKATAPGAQQLSLTSSTTLQRPCSLRVRSAQAIQPTRPQRSEPSSLV